ncbi:hypothetical protein ABIB25_000927 [Nakamurella sp. UYEF19]
MASLVLLLGAFVASPVASASTPIKAAALTASSTMSGVRQVKTIGYSRQHRAIVAYELGNPAAPTKDLVLGSMHGFYEEAGEQVVAGIKGLAIPNDLDLWVISTINPDGDVLGQHANAANVDLNRNWPNLWQYNAGNPGSALDNHASGPYALSEPETQAMYNFLRWLKPARVVSMHQPLDGVDTTDGGGLAQGRAFRDALAANLGLPEVPFTCFGGCHGSMTGWLTNYTSSVAITVEFNWSPSSSYLTGQAARGIVAALGVGVKPWAPPAPKPRLLVIGGVNRPTGVWSTGITVTGWSADPAHVGWSNTVTLWVGGHQVTVTANGPSAAVDRIRHLLGGHSFSVRIPAKAGRYAVCVAAHAAHGSTSIARFLGACQSVTVPQRPAMHGHVDIGSGVKGGIRVAGWVVDPLHLLYGEYAQIKVNGHPVATVRTTVNRPDVNRLFKTSGTHGFDVLVKEPPGRYTLTVTALATATASQSAVLNTRVVTVPN